MAHIGIAVARGRMAGGLHRQIGRRARRGKRGKRARVQLVGKGISQRMVGDRWHETLSLLGHATLFSGIVKFFC
jgi:hypothetical protein